MARVQSPKKWKRVPKAISETEMMALLHAPAPATKSKLPAYNVELQLAVSLRDRSIIEVLYSSAIRASELIGAELQSSAAA